MLGRSYQLRFAALIAGTSFLLLVLCTIPAYLYHREYAEAKALDENRDSAQAALSLEASLRDLIALHERGVRHVVPLQDRIVIHLQDISDHADKEKEQEFYRSLERDFAEYRRLWEADQQKATQTREPNPTLIAVLKAKMLPVCEQLRTFNQGEREQSKATHRRFIGWLAWGLAGIGGAASIAGLFLGYGFARGLSQSIHQLQVRVFDAATKLGQDLPPVSLTDSGDLEALHGQMQDLMAQIEQTVQKLHQREREVLRADQLAATGRLAAGVAHEIRNPLTSIKLLVQASREDTEGRGMPPEDLGVIEREVRRMEHSLQVFLNFARPPKLHRSAQDLATLVDHTVDLVRGRAAKQNVLLRVDRPRRLVPLDVDGEQLQQVLVNLALNALDAMPHGGTLEFVLREPRDGAVELSVRDTGPGVSPAMMPRLFEPFASDKETGLGLGLVVSRRIVEDHGGTLGASNRNEGGACFTLRLPAA